MKYHAFDKDLQLWVAACLYKGAVDSYRTFVGEMDDETADRHYAESITLGTTLQVTPEMWPPDRAAFDAYWQQQLDAIHIDDAVREYLYPDCGEPSPRRRPAGPAAAAARGPRPAHHHRVPAAALPRRDAAAVGRRRQRRFDRLMAVLRTAVHLSPGPLRQFPFNLLLKDLDWRIRTGRPLV